jgi:uncharacterized membrane protein
MEEKQKTKTALGLNENIEGLLCYVLGWVTGIVFLVIEKKNKFVRFHAMQSLATFLPITIGAWIISWIPFIGPFFGTLLWILGFILWLILIAKTYQGEKFKLPLAGDFAEKQVEK